MHDYRNNDGGRARSTLPSNYFLPFCPAPFKETGDRAFPAVEEKTFF